MNHLTTWLVKDKVILTCIQGALRKQDLPEVDNRMITLFESSQSNQIHVLSDISMMTTMPGIFDMSKLQYIRHPKIGYFITQSRNPVEEFIGNTVGQMIKSKYQFVKTLDEGIEYLTQIDKNLPSISEMQQQASNLLEDFVSN